MTAKMAQRVHGIHDVADETRILLSGVDGPVQKYARPTRRTPGQCNRGSPIGDDDCGDLNIDERT
jgi:hypothetical protein